jgi:hypothetical protein
VPGGLRRRTRLGRRGWIVVAVVGVLVALWAASELFLPGYAAHRIASQLEKHGGQVHVTVKSRPALRLLFTDGDWLSVDGTGVSVDLPNFGAPPKNVLGKLDGFTNVDIELRQVSAPPLRVSAFSLSRHGNSSAYRLKMTGTTTASDLAGYVGGALGSLGASVLVPNANAPLPIQVDYALQSNHGRAVVTGGAGQVAGVPLGPLGAAVASAILDRIQ